MNDETDDIPHDGQTVHVTFKYNDVALSGEGATAINVASAGSGYYNPYTHKLTLEKARLIESALDPEGDNLEGALWIAERVIELLEQDRRPATDAARVKARAEYIMRMVNGE